MTITEFIAARLDETEAAARTELEIRERIFPAECTVEYGWSRLIRHTSGGYGSAVVPGAPSPGWVLADVDAKRAILAWHPPAPDGRHCSTCVAEDSQLYGALYEEAPCLTVRYLAAAYADHPDFDSQLSPT